MKRGIISLQDYLDAIKPLNHDLWYASIPEKQRQIYDLGKDFNQGVIGRSEYLEKIKPLDKGIWLNLLEGKDKELALLEERYDNHEISESQYYCDVATIEGRPFIDMVKIETDNPNGIGMEFLWNDLFISTMRENGFKGGTDEEVVNHWFTAVATSIAVESDSVIVVDPDEIGKLRKKGGKTEHF